MADRRRPSLQLQLMHHGEAGAVAIGRHRFSRFVSMVERFSALILPFPIFGAGLARFTRMWCSASRGRPRPWCCGTVMSGSSDRNESTEPQAFRKYLDMKAGFVSWLYGK